MVSRIRALAAGLGTHRLVRHSAVYTGSSVVRGVLPFVLLPVLTRYLSPAELGVVATFEVVLAIGLVAVGLNMPGAIAIGYFRMESTAFEIYVANVVFVSLAACLLTFAVGFAVLGYLPSDLGALILSWLPLLALASLAQVLFSIVLTLWQVRQRPVPYGLFQIAHTVMNLLFSLLFVIVFSWGWRGRVGGIIAAALAFGALSAVLLARRLRHRWLVRREYLRDALAFGIPLVPHSLGNWILTGIDRVFLASMVGIATTGVYAVGYQIGMVVGLFATSFNQAWSPFLFEKLREGSDRTKARIVKFTYLYMVGIAVFALVLGIAAPPFMAVFVGPEFQESSAYVFWVSLGYAANGMYLMIAHYIYFVKKTYLLAWITFFAAVVHIVLNYVLIETNGAVGAAQASAGSFAVSFVLTWILAARVYRMPWSLADARYGSG